MRDLKKERQARREERDGVSTVPVYIASRFYWNLINPTPGHLAYVQKMLRYYPALQIIVEAIKEANNAIIPAEKDN